MGLRQSAVWSAGLIIGVFAFLLFPSIALSQTLNFKNYSGNDVLPSSKVYTAFQDSKGFIWFATERGACRYDGYKFTTYTIEDGLSDNDILDLFEDSSGRLWFQTLNGKISYYKNGEFFNSVKDTTLRSIDSDSYIQAMAEDKRGNTWIITHSSGLILYSKTGRVHRFFESGEPQFEFVKCFSLVSDHCIQIVTWHGAYQITFDKELERITEIKKCNDIPAVIEFCKTCQLTDDKVLVGTSYGTENAVYLNDTKLDTAHIFFKSNQRLLDVTKDEDYVWISSMSGTVRYEQKTQTFHPAILTDYAVTSVLKDWEGNYWFTTHNNGVFFCTSLAMYAYTAKNGLLTNNVTCLAKGRDDKIWLGYGKEESIGYISQGKVYAKKIFDTEIFETRKIYFSENRCWIGASSALSLIENSRVIKTGSGGIKDVFEYPENTLWLSNNHGIFRSKKMPDHYWDIEKNVPALRTLATDRGGFFFLDSRSDFWISTYKGLYKYVGDTLQVVDLGSKMSWAMVSDFAELADQTLILGTLGHGVVFLKDGKNILNVNEAMGLSNGICKAVSVDKNGTIWVGTNDGLNKISGYPNKINVEHFHQEDGILAKEVSDVLVVNDTVWVATELGLNVFNSHQLQKKYLPPRMYINGLTLRGKPVTVPSSNSYEFYHHENDIGISYTGLSFQSAGNILYRYKLHAEDPWRYTRHPSVYLPQLSPGSYEFIIAAKGRSDAWSKVASVSFEIQKPFWLTGFFLAAAAIALIGVGWAGTAYYFNQQKKKTTLQNRVALSELRSLRAQMNPHFLFNALNSIQGVLQKKNFETARDYLGRFGRLMRQILDHSHRTSITIAEEVESITNYLEIEQFRSENQFQYVIEVDPAIHKDFIEIPAMILQPFIENAIWHGFGHNNPGDKLTITFGLDNKKDIVITIKDNGIGRKRSMELRADRQHKSKGIQLVKERIDILNQGKSKKIELSVEDLVDAQGNHPGTLVTLKIPS